MTPLAVAGQMVNFLQTDPSTWRVIDPACGDGNLLLAVAERLIATNCVRPAQQLCGYDIDPEMALQARDRVADLIGVSATELNIQAADFLRESEGGLTF